MPQGTFSGSNPPIQPPAVCKVPIVPFPPPVPGMPPSRLQGYARWTDLDPGKEIDVATYLSMPQQGDAWIWSGQVIINEIIFIISLGRVTPPDIFQVTLTVFDPWRHPENYAFPAGPIQIDPTLDTGVLTHTVIPGRDFRRARVSQ